MNTSELIYDWNKIHPGSLRPVGPVLLNDETLRDGLQSPSVRDPQIDEKIRILHLMEALGINMLDLGLPGAGPRAVEHVTALAREIATHRMKILPNCAARTHENDIRPIADIVQKTGIKIEAATFLGSSPIRRYTEGWTDDFLLQTTEKAVKFAVSLGLDPMYVTEDTTRCDPETVKRLYKTAIECGARAIVICDTCGHVTPSGVTALIHFVIDEVVKPSGEKIRVDWHGHCDRGLAVANSLAALAAGADCVHACAIGIGERVGNTQMDQMLVNLKLMGVPPWDEQDLTSLKDYCETVSRATGVILATPEYHGTFSSVIKLVIENLGFPSVLASKPVALLGVAAGQIGAIKAIEGLASVCTHVGALVLPGAVSVANVQSVFDAEGRCLDPGVEKRIRSVAVNLIDYIHGAICPRIAMEAMARGGSK